MVPVGDISDKVWEEEGHGAPIRRGMELLGGWPEGKTVPRAGYWWPWEVHEAGGAQLSVAEAGSEVGARGCLLIFLPTMRQ